MESQNEDDFDLNVCFDDERIIYRILHENNYIKVRINTMTIIENLPVTNANIHESLFSRLPMRDSAVLTSLTGSSSKVSDGRRKGGRN